MKPLKDPLLTPEGNHGNCIDVRHGKTDLKVFVAVAVAVARGRAHPSFGMTLTF